MDQGFISAPPGKLSPHSREGYKHILRREGEAEKGGSHQSEAIWHIKKLVSPLSEVV